MLGPRSKSTQKVSSREMIRYLTQVKGLGRPNLHREMRQQEVSLRAHSPAAVYAYPEEEEVSSPESELMSLLLKSRKRPSLPRKFYQGKSMKSADDSVNIIDSDDGRIVIPLKSYDRVLSGLRIKSTIKRQLKITETEEMHRRFKLLVEKICPSARMRLIKLPAVATDRSRDVKEPRSLSGARSPHSGRHTPIGSRLRKLERSAGSSRPNL